MVRAHLCDLTLGLLLCLVATAASAQPLFGPTTITVSPPSPTAGVSFQAHVSGSISAPCVVNSANATVVATTIELTGFFTCSTLPGTFPYSFTVNVPALPPGAYTIQELRRLRFNPAPSPYANPIAGGSLPIVVIDSAGNLNAIPVGGRYSMAATALLVAGIALLVLRRRSGYA
jgi:hypothetical protein